MRVTITSIKLVKRHLILSGALLLVSLFGSISYVSAASDDDARDGRLITIHDRGSEKVILTHARTIQDALKYAQVQVMAQDTVEPSLDEELVATDYTVNIYRARPVIVADGQMRQKIMTAEQTPKAIVSAAGLELNDEDKASVSASDIVTDGAGETLTIDRATPFTFDLYGTPRQAYTQAKTVKEMLKTKRITLAHNDTLSVPEDTPITPNMTIAILRNGVQTATVEEPITFPVRQIQDADQPAGYRQIQTPGTNGKKSVTYEITVQNGKEVGRKVMQSVVLEQPKEQVEVVGAKPSFSGDFAAALAKLRSCESGGNYANKKNPLYRGAYQFSYSTWGNKYGIYDPADASPAQQDQAARELYVRRGWQPWPHCGSTLPDTYR
jgi:resuscitation-promoting factor RpfB